MLNFNPLQAFYQLIWSSNFQLSTLWKVCQVSPFLASCRSWCWLAVPSSALWSNTFAVKNTSLSWLFFIIPFDFSIFFWVLQLPEVGFCFHLIGSPHTPGLGAWGVSSLLASCLSPRHCALHLSLLAWSMCLWGSRQQCCAGGGFSG